MTSQSSSTRILILGAGKSGTSALFHCVAQSAEQHYGTAFARSFEPKTEQQLEAVSASHCVVKVLAERVMGFADPHRVIGSFGRRLMIVRDPRDTVVSRLLWLVATRIGMADPVAAQTFLAALREKESAPHSRSVLALYDLAAPVAGFGSGYAAKVRDLAFLPLDMLRRFPDFHRLRYEDFVARRWEPVEAYLGFPLLDSFSLPPRQTRILRTGSAGGWRNWFLPEDTAYFSDSQAEALAALGYRREAAAARQVIDPAEATGYIARVRDDIARLGG